jgi:hypothetical protein
MPKKLFTDKQEAALKAMEIACGDCQGRIESLKALGLDMTDREGYNAQRLHTIERIKAVRDQYESQQD